jgi:tRNA(Ile)-lysidine synthase
MRRKTKLQLHVLDTIRRHRMMQAGDRVAVAVSGGADSVALLRLLEDMANELGITLCVVHFNHALRGAESDVDEQFVAELANEAGLEFVSVREDVAAAARNHGWNLEDAARRLRYAFFVRVVESGRATRVAVAHSADDQAETVLARIIRGTGLTGLAGIYPVVGHVVRPLIEVRRAELRAFLEHRGQAWREDASNRDTRRLRARLRLDLLPDLEEKYNPAIVERLNALGDLAREDEKLWAVLVEDRFRTLATRSEEGISLGIPDLLSPLRLAPEEVRALSQRLVRRILEELRGDRSGITIRHVLDVLYLARESSSGRRIQLPGVVIEKIFDRLLFSSAPSAEQTAQAEETGADADSYQYVVELPASGSAMIAVPEVGRRFQLKLIDWPACARDTKRAVEALDADRLRSPLVLRNWRPGDAYRPRGRGGVRKLKQLFLKDRIAVRERARWPVLTSAGKLAWVRGMPPAEEFAAGRETRKGLVIAEEGL